MRGLPIAALFAAAVPLAWLLPNHYLPWPAAWLEGAALGLLFVAALLVRQPAALPLRWALPVAVALLSIAWQAASGRILFSGDAVMAALYVAAFLLAIGCGAALQGAAPRGRGGFVEVWAGMLAMAAVVSGVIALLQWTGVYSHWLLMADLPPGARPFGNLAQANHLCTAAFLGLCALLLLREGGRIGVAAWAVVSGLLVFTMVMTGSRTGWLQMGALLLMAGALAGRTGSRIALWQVAAMVAGYGLLALAWPTLNDGLLLSGQRPVAQQWSGGGRELLWPALWDAVWRHPVSGYGWQQMVLAQLEVATDHPAIGRHFETAHNLVLDLLLWAGVPVGGTIAIAAVIALGLHVARLREARALWLLCGVVGVAAHSMLELPLHFAYFLAPVGLALGAAFALEGAGKDAGERPRRLRVPGPALAGAGALLGALFALIAVDYLVVEQNHRILRLESARIGVLRLETPAPEVRLLDQQQAFLEFARLPARPGMTADEIETMRRVSHRFAYPGSLLRYALAAGLNGRPDEAALTLRRLCRIHPPPRCDEAREAWSALRSQYPGLPAVTLP